jgi:hypothetical protein
MLCFEGFGSKSPSGRVLNVLMISRLHEKYAADGWFSLGDLHIATKTTVFFAVFAEK